MESARLFRKAYARRKQFSLTSFGSVDGKISTVGRALRFLRRGVRAAGRRTKPRRCACESTAKTLAGRGQGRACRRRYEMRLTLSKGEHLFRELRELPFRATGALVARGILVVAPSSQCGRGMRELILDRFELDGPFRIDPRERSLASVESRKRIVLCAPGKDGSVERAAHVNSVGLCDAGVPATARSGKRDRALRRSDARRCEGGPVDRAIQTGLTAILVSPHFLFRVEQPGNPGEGGRFRLDQFVRIGFATLVFLVEQHAGRRAVPAGVRWLTAKA